MTPKSPEQIAAELYPQVPDGFLFTGHEYTNAKRAAWLSRQAEVDELKSQLEWFKQKLMLWENTPEKGALATLYLETQSQLAAKEKEIEVLKKQLEICESQLEDYRNMK